MAPESFETRMEKARKLLAEQERQLERLKQTALFSPRQVLEAVLRRKHKLLHPCASLLLMFPVVIAARPRPAASTDIQAARAPN